MLAPGFDLFPSLKSPHKTLGFHRIAVLLVTFLAFHASRKPPSIVKSVLVGTTLTSTSNSSGWAPFDGPGGAPLLGWLDLAFLSSYSLGMYCAGHAGDRIDLRLFLVAGMAGSGVLTVLFGLAYWWDVHSFKYFMVVQLACGLFQSIGWPCVVAVVGNWFGKAKRGLIMGTWNSHTSVGNIVGSVIASAVLEFGWGWSFVVPGGLVIVVGVGVFMFLLVSPDDIGFENEGKLVEMDDVEVEGKESSKTKLVSKEEEEEVGLLGVEHLDTPLAIGFREAWCLPGVLPFACCLFFSKLVAYTFLYWLPFYIRHTAVAGVHLSHKAAGILSTLFDIGGVFGGILAGYVSDVIDARAVTSVSFLVLSVPALILYRAYGSISMITNIALMFISGLLVNGPYALITTAVAADLGTQEALSGNARALATVTAIIDGTGSVGAAFGPVLAGYVSTRGWNYVFAMLIAAIIFAAASLYQVALAESRKILERRLRSSSTPAAQ